MAPAPPLGAWGQGQPWAFETGQTSSVLTSYILTWAGGTCISNVCRGLLTTRIHSFVAKRRAWFHPSVQHVLTKH